MLNVVIWKKCKRMRGAYYIGPLLFLYLIIKERCCFSVEHTENIIAADCGRTPVAVIRDPEKASSGQPSVDWWRKWVLFAT